MAGTLKLTVASVDGTLPRTDAVGNPDPYCKLSLLSSPPAVVASVQAEATTVPAWLDAAADRWLQFVATKGEAYFYNVLVFGAWEVLGITAYIGL